MIERNCGLLPFVPEVVGEFKGKPEDLKIMLDECADLKVTKDGKILLISKQPQGIR